MCLCGKYDPVNYQPQIYFSVPFFMSQQPLPRLCCLNQPVAWGPDEGPLQLSQVHLRMRMLLQNAARLLLALAKKPFTSETNTIHGFESVLGNN